MKPIGSRFSRTYNLGQNSWDRPACFPISTPKLDTARHVHNCPPPHPCTMLFWPWCLPIQILWSSKQHWKRGGGRTDTYAVVWALLLKAIGKYGRVFNLSQVVLVWGCSLALILNFPALDTHYNFSRALEGYPRLAPFSNGYVFLLVSTLVRVLPYWANAVYNR